MEVQVGAWVCIFYSGSGLAASIPAAAGMPEGALYFETDTAVLKQVQSGAWEAIAAIPAVFGIIKGETLRNSNDTEKSTQSSTYVKLKEVLLNADLPNCTIKFDGIRLCQKCCRHCAT